MLKKTLLITLLFFLFFFFVSCSNETKNDVLKKTDYFETGRYNLGDGFGFLTTTSIIKYYGKNNVVYIPKYKDLEENFGPYGLIDEYAFTKNAVIEKIVFQDEDVYSSLKIGKYCFYKCVNFTHMNVYEFGTIDEYAFYNTNITFDEVKLNIVEECAFSNITGKIKTVIFKEDIPAKICSDAFRNSNIGEIVLPKKIEYLDSNCFRGLSGTIIKFSGTKEELTVIFVDALSKENNYDPRLIGVDEIFCSDGILVISEVLCDF